MSAMDLRVGNKYRIGRKIGSGSFGDIYLGKALGILLFLRALKFEDTHACKTFATWPTIQAIYI